MSESRPSYDIEAMGNWLEGALAALIQAGTPLDSFSVCCSNLGVAINLRDGRVITRRLSDDVVMPHQRKQAAARVYLIAAVSGQIKIGIAQNVESRLRGLQNAHGDPLTVLVTFDGGRELEQKLHKVLAAYRLKGEWFQRGPWVDALIASANNNEGAGQLLRRVREAIAP